MSLTDAPVPTLSTLSDFSLQQVFDFVCRSLIEQGEPSSNENRRCYYRHPTKGLCCAAGFLIPDDQYDPEMELEGLIDSVVERFFPNLTVSSEQMNLIAALQSAHDHSVASPEPWASAFKDEARRLARNHQLNMEVLDQ